MANIIVNKIIDEEMVLVRYEDPLKYLDPIPPIDLDGKNEIFMDW